jgi:hypothetical protein
MEIPSENGEVTNERRRTKRQNTTDHEVRCLTELKDGTVLEGKVTDCSPYGARITGPTSGLVADDRVKLTFVFRTEEEVGYECRVVHVASDGVYFGVEFESGPIPIVVKDVQEEPGKTWRAILGQSPS